MDLSTVSCISDFVFLLKVLWSHYPEVMITCPSIGRQGKAMRRQQQRRILESSLNKKSSKESSLGQNQYEGSCTFYDVAGLRKC